MNWNDPLDLILRDVLSAVNPSGEDRSIRFRIINDIKDVVESIESLRGATVEPFGSFASNLFTRWGDLDISIELSTRAHISSAGKEFKQSLLGEILRPLVEKGGFRILQFNFHAKVPILKIMSRHNISCDISIDNLSGRMKSKILFWINEIDGRFRDLVLLVKEWARAQHINDPKSGTLNSYSLSLLVIFHFQTCVPAIFPPIREIYPRNMVDDLRGVRAEVEEQIKQTCEEQIYKFKTNRSRKINRSSLSQLFITFLAKFKDISLRAPTQGISVYNGQWEEIENNMPWLPKTYALFIEDPFEQPSNTARTVSKNLLNRISEAFQRSHQLLASGTWNRFSIISTLAPASTLRCLSRTPAGSQYFNGSNNVGAVPSSPLAMHLPKQHQAREKGADMHQSYSNPSRFMQPSNGRGGGTSSGFVQPSSNRSDGTSSGFVQPSNGRGGGTSSGFVQPSNGRGGGTSRGFVQPSNGFSGGSSSGFMHPSNGRSGRTSNGFVQSYNGRRAVHPPPHQQKNQKTEVDDHHAGPSNRPIPQSSNGPKAQTWKGSDSEGETEGSDAEGEEKENHKNMCIVM